MTNLLSEFRLQRTHMDQWINIYKHLEKVVGCGYYALRKTKYGTKLVRSDRSPSSKALFDTKRQPSVGHNDRRQSILNKRKVNE